MNGLDNDDMGTLQNTWLIVVKKFNFEHTSPIFCTLDVPVRHQLELQMGVWTHADCSSS